jgi:hypothetical protein
MAKGFPGSGADLVVGIKQGAVYIGADEFAFKHASMVIQESFLV